MMERPIKKPLIFPGVEDWKPDYIVKEFRLLNKYADYLEQQIDDLRELVKHCEWPIKDAGFTKEFEKLVK